MKRLCVSSIGRSGSSMTVGIFVACGAWAGPTRPGNAINPKGFFEIAQLSARAKALTQRQEEREPIKNDELLSIVEAHERRHARSRPDGAPFVFKCPAIAARSIAPLRPFWIVPIRPRQAILASIKAVGMRRGVPDDEVLSEITWSTQLVLDMALSQGGAVVFTEDVAKGDFASARLAVEAAGLTWNEAAVSEFVETSFWHYEGAA